MKLEEKIKNWLRVKDRFETLEQANDWVDFVCENLAGEKNQQAIDATLELLKINQKYELEKGDIKNFLNNCYPLADQETVCRGLLMFSQNEKIVSIYKENSPFYEEMSKNASEREFKELNARLNEKELAMKEF